MAATDDQGATPRELLLEACRRNNASLLAEVLASPPLSSRPPAIAHFLNTTMDGLGSSALHVAAQYGSYEVLDLVLDQEGVEIDHRERREGDTCLHRAVRFCNEAAARGRGGEGERVVEILIDAGCDPRIRNKAKLRPIELADPRNTALRLMLRKAEMALLAGGDVVNEDADEKERRNGAGSESD